MIETSDLFRRRIRQSGKRKTVVDVWYAGLPVEGALGLPVISGRVNVDLNSSVRRSGSVVIGDRKLVPQFDGDILSPLGAELKIYQGLPYQDGSEELVPLGVFPIEDVRWNYANGSIPTITFYDRAKNFERAEILRPVTYAGMTAMQAIVKAANSIMDVDIFIEDGLHDYIIPGGVIHDSGSYWEIIQEYSANIGGVPYFDVYGTLVISRRRVLTSSNTYADSVWDFDAGPEGILVAADQQVSRDNIYNYITVIGSARPNGNIPSASGGVTDPTSPIRIGGPFPLTTKKITDSGLTSDEQCQIRLNYELQRSSLPTHSLDLTAVGNPALQEEDIVTAKFPNGQKALHQIMSMEIPLGPGDFTATTLASVAGNAEAPPPQPAAPIPAATTISFASNTRGSITVRWDPISEAVAYEVVRGPKPFVFYYVSSGTEMEWKGLRPGTSYTFSVKGINWRGDRGLTSNVITASTDP